MADTTAPENMQAGRGISAVTMEYRIMPADALLMVRHRGDRKLGIDVGQDMIDAV